MVRYHGCLFLVGVCRDFAGAVLTFRVMTVFADRKRGVCVLLELWLAWCNAGLVACVWYGGCVVVALGSVAASTLAIGLVLVVRAMAAFAARKCGVCGLLVPTHWSDANAVYDGDVAGVHCG